MNLMGEPAFVGRHCGGNDYTIDEQTVRFYEDALDDRHPLHERFAPPLLHHSECYKHLGQWYLANLFGNLHGQQDWSLFAPIPIGARVRTRSTIVDRYSRRGRDWVVNETDLMSAEPGDQGRLFVRGRTYQSFLPAEKERGEGFVVDQGTAKQKPARPPFPTATGPDLAPVEKLVDQRRCWMFSGPGANYHTDREQASKLGFPDIVVQGMMSTCFVSQVMQDHFGMGWLEGGRMSVKLTNVLWVDEHVTARARIRDEVPEGTRTRIVCDVWVEKDDGTRVILGEASALREDGRS
ncbi:MAG: MaoC family dehydratase [Myxococcales bacterium]|nr:MaoC family dehydratase [Myxococcales bacterium]